MEARQWRWTLRRLMVRRRRMWSRARQARGSAIIAARLTAFVIARGQAAWELCATAVESGGGTSKHVSSSSKQQHRCLMLRKRQPLLLPLLRRGHGNVIGAA